MPKCPVLHVFKPTLADITPGSRWKYRAKVGGVRQTVDIICCTHPYKRDIGNGRRADYVDIFGYACKGGERWVVNIKKLFQVRVEK